MPLLPPVLGATRVCNSYIRKRNGSVQREDILDGSLKGWWRQR